jgi:hypothetical protein
MPPASKTASRTGKEIIFFQGDREEVGSKLGDVANVSEFTFMLPKSFRPGVSAPGKKAFHSSPWSQKLEAAVRVVPEIQRGRIL